MEPRGVHLNSNGVEKGGMNWVHVVLKDYSHWTWTQYLLNQVLCNPPGEDLDCEDEKHYWRDIEDLHEDIEGYCYSKVYPPADDMRGKRTFTVHGYEPKCSIYPEYHGYIRCAHKPDWIRDRFQEAFNNTKRSVSVSKEELTVPAAHAIITQGAGSIFQRKAPDVTFCGGDVVDLGGRVRDTCWLYKSATVTSESFVRVIFNPDAQVVLITPEPELCTNAKHRRKWDLWMQEFQDGFKLTGPAGRTPAIATASFEAAREYFQIDAISNVPAATPGSVASKAKAKPPRAKGSNEGGAGMSSSKQTQRVSQAGSGDGDGDDSAEATVTPSRARKQPRCASQAGSGSGTGDGDRGGAADTGDAVSTDSGMLQQLLAVTVTSLQHSQDENQGLREQLSKARIELSQRDTELAQVRRALAEVHAQYMALQEHALNHPPGLEL